MFTNGIIKNKIGFTLIETIVALFLFSIIIACLFSVLATARSSWTASSSQVNVQQEARRGLSAMVRELRQANLPGITGVPADGADYNSITFQIPASITAGGTIWSSNIQYSLGGLNGTQLLKTQDASQRVLANNISAVTFNRTVLSPDTINISVTTQKNTFPGFNIIQSNITLNSEVKVRN